MSKQHQRVGIYAGSFDPVTMGHLYMMTEGARLFDRFIIAVGDNPDKLNTFTQQERLDMVRRAVKDIENCEVEAFTYQYLVDYARKHGAQYILRGIRSEQDYAYERRMRHVNADLAPQITTVFLMPPRQIAEISSSFVKGLVGPAGWQKVVRPYVPPAVYDLFIAKLEEHAARLAARTN